MGNLGAALTQGLRTPASHLTIQAAKHGGYVVVGNTDYGELRSALFAGSLADVLEFVRVEFEGLPVAPDAEYAQAVS